MTTQELAKIIGISKRKIEQNTAILKKSGRLKRVGTAKGGHWIPVNTADRGGKKLGLRVGVKVGDTVGIDKRSG